MYTLKYSEVELDGRQNRKKDYDDLSEKHTKLEKEHQKTIQEQHHIKTENENLKKLLKREQNKLANLLHTQNEVSTSTIVAEMNNLTMENNKIVHHYNLLCEQITHFAAEAEEKQKNL
ncbi:hypothetical protein CAEBREN_10477 [Caenorhabditis brenneri]|uniref:Uncharacterized protein n=1 Tax=Caenorhabditis brenneri TaxID=135651 RepID=G0PDY9_CAEBE|nr:hypothetical protein CAEBREN_10477 [Caenorhabditis brenneri]